MAKTFTDPKEQEEFERFIRSRGIREREGTTVSAERMFEESRGNIAITTKRGPAIERHPVTDPKLYSPFDQKQLDKLYTQRSKIATDATLDEPARQRGLDIVDASIGRVPMLTPSRQEPTAQQKFDAGIVTTPDGIKGRLDKNDKFVPFEGNKIENERRAGYSDTFASSLQSQFKVNETREGDEIRDVDSMVKQAAVEAGMKHGFDLQPDFITKSQAPVAPSLTPNWAGAMFNLDRAGAGKRTLLSGIRGKQSGPTRATEEQMLTEMSTFVNEAISKGISDSVATVDFMTRWRDEVRQDLLGLVPPFPKALERRLALGKMITANPETLSPAQQVRQESAQQPQGRPSVEGAFSVEGDTIRFQTVAGGSKSATAKGFGAMWAQLRPVHQRNLVSKLNQGFTAAQLVKVFQDNPEEFK